MLGAVLKQKEKETALSSVCMTEGKGICLLQMPLLDLYSLEGDAVGMKIKLNSGFEAQHF